jgi:mono/diheme cytochrome c family protein
MLTALVCAAQLRAEVITQADAQKLIMKSGCMACHAIDAARVGPAYKDVAKKYAAPDAETKKYLEGKSPLEYLKIKVREGTKIGKNKHWIKDEKTGRPFGMMTPNPKGRISDEDLTKLLEYILSLK